MTPAHKAKMAAARDAAAEKRRSDKAGAAEPQGGNFYNPSPDLPPHNLAQAPAQVVYQPIPPPSPLAASASASSDVSSAAANDLPLDNGGNLVSEIARIRSLRRPLGAFAQKLALPERPGYHRHWFNDTPGRIDEAEANGWAFVRDRDGKDPISRVVGTGRDNSALKAYAMELPAVLWQEDIDAKHAEAKSRIDGIKASPFRSKPGEAKAADKGKFYSPQEDVAPLSVEVR